MQFSTFGRKIPCETGDSQTIDTYHCRNNLMIFHKLIFLLMMLARFEPARQRYLKLVRAKHTTDYLYHTNLHIFSSTRDCSTRIDQIR